MSKKTKSIPVNSFAEFSFYISRTSFQSSGDFKEFEQPHRDDLHLFLLQEKGTTSIEIDFQKYKMEPLSVIYIHPTQVHRLIGFENATISSWAINNENLKPEYLKLLEDITPVKNLSLDEKTFSIIVDTVSLCIEFSERKQEKLYNSLLKDSGNTLVALVVSQYLAQSKPTDNFSRFEFITKSFKSILENNFVTIKSPMNYAKKLNISTPYLNECVKNTTGHSVSYHIQQRIVLEAKRLLYHSDKSVKEIATDLGYEDYPYFSRLFSKVTGITALAFRNKNHD
ncbi:AraC family transcriptional regulator [Flavobacterium sp. WC2509]|uniref:AraC family transcriptional regulator n=1 Tax=Flavobacterium sp. WC2509 TaxID=3461406 RepID=UPI00404470A4